jgi:RNAse (barnase) inhibitor barstar
MTTKRIDASRIHDAKTFHDVLAETLGFPAHYGRNMDALVDCLGDLGGSPDKGVIVLQLDHAGEFAARCPDLFAKFLDVAAFVNWRQAQAGRPPVLALAYDRA